MVKPAALTEDDLYQLYRCQVAGLHDRVENSESTGMPDVFSVTYHKVFWLELKQATIKEEAIYIRASQVNWICMRGNFGDLRYRNTVYILTNQFKLYNANLLVTAMHDTDLTTYFTNKPEVYRVPIVDLGIPSWSGWNNIREELGAILHIPNLKVICNGNTAEHD